MTPDAGRSFLVVGASGQVGSQIASILGPDRVIGTSRRQDGDPRLIPLDLALLAGRNEDARGLVERLRVDAVYCVGGMTDVERCESEPELAMRINCDGPATLAAAFRGLPFVYFSTEYVFDGRNGPYGEDAPAGPLNAYGRSKWMGELAVIAAHPRALIVRTTGVYGPDPGGRNFLYSLRRAVSGGKQFRVPLDQVSTPTYNCDLGAAVVALSESGASGIFHVCGPERISRLDFAVRAAKAMGLDASQIVGVPTAELGQHASRPLDAGLSIDKLRKLHPSLRMRGVEESIGEWTANGGAVI